MDQIELTDTEKTILIALSKNLDGRRINEILRETGLSKATFMRHVKRLIELGLVTKEIRANEGYPPPVYYKLTEKSRDIAIKLATKNAIEKLSFVSKLPTLTDEDRKKIEELIKKLESL
jgi:DNA-binding MarR family transcriptional regulator